MGKKMSINRIRLYSFLIYPAALLLVLGCATEPMTVVKTGESIAPAIQQPDTSPPAQQKKDIDSKPITATSTPVPQVVSSDKVEVKDIAPSEARIFFEPSKSASNQVLGIDFTMAENGKSRLIVTTAKKTSYDLDRKDEKTLILKIHDSTIANPLLMRQIDTTQFQSALDGIKQVYLSQKKEVDLILSLREIVPFNVKPTDNGINMDFGQTSVKAVEKKLVPLELAETETRTLSANTQAATPSSAAPVTTAKAATKKYSGEKVSLTFTDADVTHILTIINSVSGENVIWDPAITGKKVSMILNDVPWDEALDLVLDNNDLAKRYRGDNIIWVTTKEKMKQVMAEEEAEKQRIRQLAEEEEKRLQEKAVKVEEVKKTEVIKVKYTNAVEVASHISANVFGSSDFSTSNTSSSEARSIGEKTISKANQNKDVGSKYLTIDEKSNTIIITASASQIELAKKIAKQVDKPASQIMIKARVVSATKKFTKNLGVIWNSPGTRATGNFGNDTWTGTFSTNNLADNWTAGSGFNFATITGSIGNLSLDASLALAEKDGDIKTMSEPKVLTRNGTRAIIRSGRTLITPPTENVESKTIKADLSLTITPTAFSDSEYILVQTEITDDQIVSASELITKSIITDLIVKNGETIVIGGILKEEEQDNDSGVPLLKDIPGLGWLFKNHFRLKDQSELLIFLTPTIVPSLVDADE